MNFKEKVKNYKRIIVKIGTTSLTDTNGKINLKALENLAFVLSSIISQGKEVILVSSLRIDGIVSKLANVSRAKAQMMVEQGRILIDYVKVRDKSYEVKEDERITIRGVGKFILGSTIGCSKSGRLKVSIKKYT